MQMIVSASARRDDWWIHRSFELQAFAQVAEYSIRKGCSLKIKFLVLISVNHSIPAWCHVVQCKCINDKFKFELSLLLETWRVRKVLTVLPAIMSTRWPHTNWDHSKGRIAPTGQPDRCDRTCLGDLSIGDAISARWNVYKQSLHSYFSFWTFVSLGPDNKIRRRRYTLEAPEPKSANTKNMVKR